MKKKIQISKENCDSLSKKSTLRTLFFLLAGIFIVWVIAGIIFWFVFNVSDKNGGEFGDMFGVINALFSGLAFGVVIYAIFLQKEDLEISLKELTTSTKAQTKSSKALIDQSDIMLKTAKLNGHSALLTTYLSLYLKPTDPIFTENFHMDSGHRVIDHIKKIEGILKSMNKE